MKKILTCWLLLSCFLQQAGWCQAPVSSYKTSWLRDGAITVAGISAAAVGSSILTNKEKLTEEDLVGLSKNDVVWFDRFSAGNHSSKAEQVSDVFFYGSFVTPMLLLFDDKIKQDAPQVYLLYAEAMSIAGGIYSLTAGLTNRKRPNVYAVDAPLDVRLHKYARNSFYGGHTAATATATFFLAKVFHDFNPGSPAEPFIWAAAAAVPVTVGYLRMRAGKHFLSDNLVGYAIGASIGILVPELHKRSSKVSLTPASTGMYNGMAITYKF
ncbi:phosphatase PAP2 family protein [Pontibacter silvestris]|uniref:Phosphatase PAP2 family protein n=1 Tax=Pontibacter silvestris TaxID=2305183 RepID=A0ABW4X5F0_9BACT|nr:phosphatase PAP2 family protein [Pontibacter silvestris]MCC9137050.1 phosphatase PAP2 family protein [Pontibacter silvestris]